MISMPHQSTTSQSTPLDTTYSLFNMIEQCNRGHVRKIMSEHFLCTSLPATNTMERSLKKTKFTRSFQKESLQPVYLSTSDGWNVLHVSCFSMEMMCEVLEQLEVATVESCPRLMFNILFERNDIGEMPLLTCLRLSRVGHESDCKKIQLLLQKMIQGVSSFLEVTQSLLTSSASTSCSCSNGDQPTSNVKVSSFNNRTAVLPTLKNILNKIRNTNGENAFDLANHVGLDMHLLLHNEMFQFSFKQSLHTALKHEGFFDLTLIQ